MAAVTLKSEGWYLTTEGIAELSGNEEDVPIKALIKKALDTDLKSIGSGVIPEDVAKGKKLPDGCVLQVVRINNVSAPKINEESNHAPRLLKIVLTDGVATCTALDLTQIKSIDVRTPPGTKIKLKGSSISCQQGYMLLNSTNIEVLGGKVEALIEKWKVKESLVNYRRSKLTQDTGPPPWVPFGQKIAGNVQDLTGKFNSLGVSTKEAKENDVFEQQRKAAIAEIAKAKSTGCKTFGGGKQALEKDSSRYDKPKFGVASTSSSGTEKTSFTRSLDSAGSGTEKTSFTRSLDSTGTGRGDRGDRGERGDRDFRESGRSERPGRGRGRRGGTEDLEDGVSVAPSRPSTLFDFLQSKMDSIAIGQLKSKMKREAVEGATMEAEGKTPSESASFLEHQQSGSSNSYPRGDSDKFHSTSYDNRRPPFKEDWKRSSDHNNHDNRSSRGSRGGSASFRGGSSRGERASSSGGGFGESNRYSNSGSSNTHPAANYGASKFGEDSRHFPNSTSSNGSNRAKTGDRHSFNHTGSNGTHSYNRNRSATSGDSRSAFTNASNTNEASTLGGADVVNKPGVISPRSATTTNASRPATITNTLRPTTNTNAVLPAFSHAAVEIESPTTSVSTTANNNLSGANLRVGNQSGFHQANPSNKSAMGPPPNPTHQHTRNAYHPGNNSNDLRPASSKPAESKFENMTCPPMPDFGLNQNNSLPPSSYGRANNYGVQTRLAGYDTVAIDSARNFHHQQPPPSYLIHQQPQPHHSNASYQPPASSFKSNINNGLVTAGNLPSAGQQTAPRLAGRTWQSGDECLAKYWEDNKHYPAVVHAVGPTGSTCVVLFPKYGNYEEVFVEDMKPWVAKEEQGNFQMNSGTVEFRRGGTRPYVVRNNFSHQMDQDSFRQASGRPTQQVYVPPAQRQ